MRCDEDWPDRRAPVLVFDLDGTILSINSFHYWVLFLIGGRIRGLGVERRVRLAARAAWLLVLRKLRRIDHASLLSALQRAWWANPSSATGSVSGPLQSMLLRRLRPNLRPLLQMVASDRVDAVLATAAAGEYAIELGQRLGFRHLLATPPVRGRTEYINDGARKRDRVVALVENVGWRDRPLILLTDHIDDLPLMRVSMAVCWFGSADGALAARDAVGDVNFLPCRELSARQILAALRSFGVSVPASLEVVQVASPLSAMTAS
jgi:phosphoserine phosphatase